MFTSFSSNPLIFKVKSRPGKKEVAGGWKEEGGIMEEGAAVGGGKSVEGFIFNRGGGGLKEG